MKKQLAAAAAVAALTALPATSASASDAGQRSASGAVVAEHVSVRTVLEGSMGPVIRGNQHRLRLETDVEGMVDPRQAAKIQSYYCPSGARITKTWTSSRCVSRGTSYLTYDRSDYRVSSTMRSARLVGLVQTGKTSLVADLTLRAYGEPTVGRSYPGVITRYADATVSGELQGATVRSDERLGSGIHRHERA